MTTKWARRLFLRFLPRKVINLKSLKIFQVLFFMVISAGFDSKLLERILKSMS